MVDNEQGGYKIVIKDSTRDETLSGEWPGLGPELFQMADGHGEVDGVAVEDGDELAAGFSSFVDISNV